MPIVFWGCFVFVCKKAKGGLIFIRFKFQSLANSFDKKSEDKKKVDRNFSQRPKVKSLLANFSHQCNEVIVPWNTQNSTNSRYIYSAALTRVNVILNLG